MGFLKRLGRKIGREIAEAAEYEFERRMMSIEDRIEGKLDEWESELYKKCTKMNKHIKGAIIEDFDEFKASWEKNASDMIQSVFHFCIAVYVYCVIDKKVGADMCTVILAKTFLLKNKSTRTGFKVNPKGDGYLLEHMDETPNTIKSYFGGTPDNNYEMDPQNLDMTVVGKYEGKTDRGVPEGCIRIDSGGKDFDTPLFLRRNSKNQWKMFGFSSLATEAQITTEELHDF